MDLSGAEDLLQKMRKATDRRDIIPAFYDYDLQFHRLLWSLTDNEYLSQMLEQIVAPLFAFFIMLNIHPLDRVDYFAEAVDHHDNVLQALKSRSPQNAHKALCGLLEISLRQQRDIISEGKSEKHDRVAPAGKRKATQSSGLSVYRLSSTLSFNDQFHEIVVLENRHHHARPTPRSPDGQLGSSQVRGAPQHHPFRFYRDIVHWNYLRNTHASPQAVLAGHIGPRSLTLLVIPLMSAIRIVFSRPLEDFFNVPGRFDPNPRFVEAP